MPEGKALVHVTLTFFFASWLAMGFSDLCTKAFEYEPTHDFFKTW